MAAIEVALPGTGIRDAEQPYGIATSSWDWNPEETRAVTPIAKSLIGKRSTVVNWAPQTETSERMFFL